MSSSGETSSLASSSDDDQSTTFHKQASWRSSYYHDLPKRPDGPPMAVFHDDPAWSYDGEDVRVHGEPREDAATFWQMFSPEEVDEPEVAEPERPVFPRINSVRAQLEHYGIPYEPSASRNQLLSLMKASVREGKFDAVPDSILAIHNALRAEWEAVQAACEADMKRWEAQLKEWKESKFASMATLTEKAVFDTEFFLEKYYLDDNGQPDRTKMPNLLILEDFPEEHRDIDTYIERVPGLTMASYFWIREKHAPDYVTLPGTAWIGWDAAEVKRAKLELATQKEMEGNQERLKKHVEYLAGSDREEPDREEPDREEPTVFGRYLVRCPALERQDEWDVLNGLYLTIQPAYGQQRGILQGVMEFDVIQGKMMLAADKKQLKMFTDVEMRDDGTDELFSDDHGASGAGKEGENTMVGGGEPLVYHFVWKGKDMERSPLASFSDELYGRITFEDRSFTRFGGEIDLSVVDLGVDFGSRCFFGGGKTSDSLECDDPYESDGLGEYDYDAEEDFNFHFGGMADELG